MENASRALIIAATTIIALLIIGSMIYLFRAGSAVGESYNQRQIQNSRELYNSKFLNFNRNNNNISDIISICNLAYDSNLSSEYNLGYAVLIDVKITDERHFVIPNVDVDNFNRKNILLVKGRNVSSDLNFNTIPRVNIYDLMEKSVKEISDITGDTQPPDNSELATMSGLQILEGDKFTKTIRSASAKNIDKKYNVMSSSSPDEDNFVNDIMIYKFLFKCDGIEYNSEGRVSKMIFSCFNNYYEDKDGNIMPNKKNGAVNGAGGINFIY